MKKMILSIVVLVVVGLLFAPVCFSEETSEKIFLAESRETAYLDKNLIFLGWTLRDIYDDRETLDSNEKEFERLKKETEDFDARWESLTVAQRRKLVDWQIEKSQRKIYETLESLDREKKKFPFHGLGIEFSSAHILALIHESSIVVMEVFKGSPTTEVSKLLRRWDSILEVNGEKFNFNWREFYERESVKKLSNEEQEVVLEKEIEEKYFARFQATVKNAKGSVVLKIFRRKTNEEKKSIFTVTVKTAIVGKDFPRQIEVLRGKYLYKLVKKNSFIRLGELSGNLEKAPEEDLKKMFKEAFLIGFHETAKAMKKYREIVYVK